MSSLSLNLKCLLSELDVQNSVILQLIFLLCIKQVFFINSINNLFTSNFVGDKIGWISVILTDFNCLHCIDKP